MYSPTGHRPQNLGHITCARSASLQKSNIEANLAQSKLLSSWHVSAETTAYLLAKPEKEIQVKFEWLLTSTLGSFVFIYLFCVLTPFPRCFGYIMAPSYGCRNHYHYNLFSASNWQLLHLKHK